MYFSFISQMNLMRNEKKWIIRQIANIDLPVSMFIIHSFTDILQNYIFIKSSDDLQILQYKL